ncbi:MAG: Cache 3/Cache 2 fusion domain-containing protein [Desulfobacterales bacterium]|nr:Cache 3/Cache 2 fusion domain-containing protein [Desulfobacterales bacterium]
MKLSLKNRFLLPTVALIIIGMGVSSGVSYYKSEVALTHAINDQLTQQAKSTTDYLGTWIRDRELNINTWSKDKAYRTAVLDSFMGKAARKSASDQLAEILKTYDFYENICVASPDGDIVAAAEESVVGKVNVKERPYFQPAMKGETIVSKVLASRQSGNPVFMIAAPLKEKDDVKGVIFAVVNLAAFSRQFIAPIKIGDSGYAYIAGSDGLVIAHPDPAVLMKVNLTDYDWGKRILSEGKGLFIYTFEGVKKLVAFDRESRQQWIVVVTAPAAEIMAPVRAIGRINLAVGLVVVLAAGLMVLLLVRSAVNPINRAVRGLNKSADQVGTASSQVASASQTLASGASQQAASLEESSASLEEMASMTRQNADNADQADKLMAETRQVVASATESMIQLITSMTAISKASEETSKIIKTIDEIAFQTNLLALNAAVEAARAGEAGAGFAVVADEVRNLAMRAADAAKNTSTLIEDTGKKVREGSTLVNRTNDAFAQVSDQAGKVADLVGEIAAASKEQAEGITQVNRAVVEMDKLTQQNAASAEESASSSEEMSAQAEQMKDLIGQLKALVDGREAHSANPAGKTRPVNVSRKKNTPMAVSSRSRVSPEIEVNPKKVLPLDDDDFQDF